MLLESTERRSSKSRAWLAMGTLVMIYYFRFWLKVHFPEESVWKTGYHGALFFDFIVTWILYAPWLLWLATESLYRRATGTLDSRC